MATTPQSTPRHAHDAFVEDAAAELTRAYPERAAKRTRRELLALIERSRERARGYGLEQNSQILKFLHCVMLLDNELAKATNADVAYVLDTLTVPNKPAERRIERALNIAKKVAAAAASGAPAGGNSGSGSAAASRLSGSPPPTPAPQTAPPAAGPRPGPLPPRRSKRPEADAAPAQAPGPATVETSQSAQRTMLPPLAAVPVRPGATASEVQSTRAEPPPAIDNWTHEESELCPNIEGFRILDKIASGGMGTVYRAHDLHLDIEVAIKVVRSLHPSAQQQFLQEARAAARLQHPNVIPVLRYERYGQGGYCVMQLVKGKDAHRLVKVFGPNNAHDLRADRLLDLAEIDRATMNPELRGVLRGAKPYYHLVAYWLAGVAEGLDRAHGEGIIHFDIKPGNMILSPDGRMMLGDFGLATLAGQQQSTGTCLGTPSYLSPEMLAAWASRCGTGETDLRVDVWGLGCTLYEMLAYKPAFDGTLSRVLRAIATTDPVPPRDAVWTTPPELEAICMKALARDPDHRYARALEMADALRDYLAGKAPVVETDRKGKWGWGKKKGGK